MTFSEYLCGLAGKRVAVIGAGISNTPLIEALLAAGVETTVYDKMTRDGLGGDAERFESLGAELRLGDGYLDDLGADVIFRTPGVMPSNPAIVAAVGNGAALTSEIEVFFDVCPCPIIAVTGSDGKTTTTTIIAEILRKSGHTVHVGGNIGTPLLCAADDITAADVAVLELSSFQLITMNRSPRIAVVTNVAQNHLDVHRDMREYIDAKRNIYMHQSGADALILNYDNEITRGFADQAGGKLRFFSSRERVADGCFLSGGTIFEAENGAADAVMSVCDILIPGAHNVENYMAAIAAVRGLADRGAIPEVARTFRGVEHRIEFVRELRGARYYNDSIASSPTRTIAGLRAFDRKVILIAGGKDKGVEFDSLGEEIVKRVKTLVLTGLTAGRIREATVQASRRTGDKPDIVVIEDFENAVMTASSAAREGDVVLLSPACTSFDRFRNFEERGELFKSIVMGMKV